MTNVLVYTLRTPKKLLFFMIEMPIVVKVVHVKLKAPIPNLIDIRLTNLVTLFWNHLEGGSESVGLVDIHESPRQIPPTRVFNIVSHNETAWRALGPKPNEWKLLDTSSFHCKLQEFLMQGINCEIDRPRGEAPFLPAAEIHPLQRA